MTDLRTAAQQALEALKDDQYRLVEVSPNQYEYKTGLLVEVGPNQYEYKTDLAIAALERALAQQAEPVATVTECEACFTPDVCQLRGTCDYYTASQMRIAAPPQQAEPVQESVYWEVRCTAHPKWMRVDEQQFDEYVANGWKGRRLYTAPPQRKPLSEEEIERICMTYQSPRQAARAIERAHGIGDNT